MRSTVRSAASLIVLVAAGMLPAGLPGQEPAPADGDGRVRTQIELGARATSLRSERAFMLGGTARFDFGGPVTFGGSGWVLTDPVELTAGEPGTGLRMRVAYAGVVTGVRVVDTRRVRGVLGVLWGAGNAKLELPAVRTEIAADNFLVLEPGASVLFRLAGPLQLTGEATYRWAMGVEDLPGISRDQIRGISLSLGLAIGPL